MNFKYVSENTFKQITLHDCVIEEIIFSDNKITFIFDHIDVLLSHPLNGTNNPKCTGKAELIFENYSELKSLNYETSYINGDKVIITKEKIIDEVELNKIAKDMEVLDVQEELSENIFQLTFSGIDEYRNFNVFKLNFEKSIVCWNEFTDDAWFAN